MKWFNEPREWNEDEGGLTLKTEPKTDFWRITHDGGVRDNGHFYYETVTGDCIVTAHLEGEFSALYDQAGVMIRIDEKNWMKCGIEYFEGAHCRSAVVTRDFSDWSITSQGKRNNLWLRVKRAAATIEVSVSEDGEEFEVFRQAYFPAEKAIQVGCMAASPAGEGFSARFRRFAIQ